MTQTHPITPPPELVEQWEAETAHTTKDEIWHVAVQAAQWGADQELEACCELVPGLTNYLRLARRPQPPSLKRQALEQMEALESHGAALCNLGVLRRALEALPND